MADEALDQQVAPDEGTQETPEQQAEREEREGQLQQGDEQPGESSQEDGEDAAAKRSKRVQKRIDQLTKQRHEALREAKEEREKRVELEKKLGSQPPADDPRPSFDNYDSVEQFEKDIEAWSRRQAQREAQAAPQQEEQQSVEEQEAMDRIRNAAIDAVDRYPDFDDVVFRQDDLPITKEMAMAAADTESVADVLYHLGKNPQEAQRLSQMQGSSLVREIGRLEAKLETQGNGAASSQGNGQSTSAPDPIQPVGGKRAKREPTNPDELDIDTWMERERERLAKQRR